MTAHCPATLKLVRTAADLRVCLRRDLALDLPTIMVLASCWLDRSSRTTSCLATRLCLLHSFSSSPHRLRAASAGVCPSLPAPSVACLSCLRLQVGAACLSARGCLLGGGRYKGVGALIEGPPLLPLLCLHAKGGLTHDAGGYRAEGADAEGPC